MIPTQISYHGVEASEALTALVRARADQLELRHQRIRSLRVHIDAPHHHRRHGNQYRVRVELALPGCDIVVGNDTPARAGDDDPYQAVRRAFDAVRRRMTGAQLRRSGKQRGQRAPRIATAL